MKSEIKNHHNSYFVSCPVGLEDPLNAEMSRMGLVGKIQKGGIQVECEFTQAMKLLFESRVASRIYKKIHSFTIENEKDIYQHGLDISWTDYFKVNCTFKINCVLASTMGKKSKFRNSLQLSLKLKDSIADRFRKDANGKRPSINLKNPDVHILIYIEPLTGEKFEEVSLLLDLSGQPLSQRGYRIDTGPAPLIENLAAGMILLSDWDPQTEDFLDIMCGSGTLLTEAALIKYKIPPCYLHLLNSESRKEPLFAIEKLNFFHRDEKLNNEYQLLKTTTKETIHTNLEKCQGTETRIFGCDRSHSSLKAVEKNAAKAMLNSCFKLYDEDATKFKLDGFKGAIFANPPYGERVGQIEKLGELYHDLGENLKNHFQGSHAYILTSNLELRKKISLRTEKRIELFNGPLECRLLKYNLF